MNKVAQALLLVLLGPILVFMLLDGTAPRWWLYDLVRVMAVTGYLVLCFLFSTESTK